MPGDQSPSPSSAGWWLSVSTLRLELPLCLSACWSILCMNMPLACSLACLFWASWRRVKSEVLRPSFLLVFLAATGAAFLAWAASTLLQLSLHSAVTHEWQCATSSFCWPLIASLRRSSSLVLRPSFFLWWMLIFLKEEAMAFFRAGLLWILPHAFLQSSVAHSVTHARCFSWFCAWMACCRSARSDVLRPRPALDLSSTAADE
mmetsp:Transcript_38090/g.89750  ORF Transcript_38090/g.89750 Transcript_38090/m.89750 type:complete len:204 (-) Transcript_38090:154-765(-)